MSSSIPPGGAVSGQKARLLEDAGELENDLESGKLFFQEGQARVAESAADALSDGARAGANKASAGHGAKGGTTSKTGAKAADNEDNKIEYSRSTAVVSGSVVGTGTESDQSGSFSLPVG